MLNTVEERLNLETVLLYYWIGGESRHIVDNLEQMRLFYQAYPKKNSGTLSRNISQEQLARAMPLSWSHYVRLVRGVRSINEREFY